MILIKRDQINLIPEECPQLVLTIEEVKKLIKNRIEYLDSSGLDSLRVSVISEKEAASLRMKDTKTQEIFIPKGGYIFRECVK